MNPRSQNARHQAENLAAEALVGRITEQDVAQLWSWPLQSKCQPPACTNPVTEGCANNGK